MLAKNIFSEFISNDNNPLDSSTDQVSTVVEGKFTPKSLAKYNGRDSPKIFIAVKNRVFDVTQGGAFYGPGGPYENFAGRDASRGLAKNSFDPEVLTDIDKPIDDLKDLSKLEIESLTVGKNILRIDTKSLVLYMKMVPSKKMMNQHRKIRLNNK